MFAKTFAPLAGEAGWMNDMHGMHSKVGGLLLTLAGVVLATGTSIAGMGAGAISGGLLTILGLSWLAHSMGACTQCAAWGMPSKKR